MPLIVDGTRFWAVVVGINAYDNIPSLDGACADATAVAEYLVHERKVPCDHIHLLLSGASAPPGYSSDIATRNNILTALYHLRDSSKVQAGDNIVFYFAGRGARYSLEGTLAVADDPLDALCPADRGSATPSGPVLDISDREVSIFLEELRDSKGNNVTVIFDCCHAFEMVQNRGADVHIRSTAPLQVENVVEMMLRAADSDSRRRSGSKQALSVR